MPAQRGLPKGAAGQEAANPPIVMASTKAAEATLARAGMSTEDQAEMEEKTWRSETQL